MQNSADTASSVSRNVGLVLDEIVTDIFEDCTDQLASLQSPIFCILDWQISRVSSESRVLGLARRGTLGGLKPTCKYHAVTLHCELFAKEIAGPKSLETFSLFFREMNLLKPISDTKNSNIQYF